MQKISYFADNIKWSSHSEMVREVMIKIYYNMTMFDAYTKSSFRMQLDGPLLPVSSFMNQMMAWQNRYKKKLNGYDMVECISVKKC